MARNSMQNIKSRISQRLKSINTRPKGKRRLLRSEVLEDRRLLAADSLNAFAAEPSEFVELGSKTVFSAADSDHGKELWVTEGPTGQTRLLKDVLAGPSSSNPQSLVAVGNHVYFTVDTGSGGELWSTDGTTANTLKVTTIAPGYGSARQVDELTAVGNSLFFSATDGFALGVELWKYDTLNRTTAVVKNIYSGNGFSSFPRDLVNVDGTLYFSAYNDSFGQPQGRELWTSNGTEVGTKLVTDLSEGTTTTRTFPPRTVPRSTNPQLLTELGDRVFFTTRRDDIASLRELWVSDGTQAGTVQLSTNTIDQMIVMSGELFFVCSNAQHGQELWATNGTVGGTRRIANIDPGTGSWAGIQNLVAADELLFFTATSGGQEGLWSSDGTSAGTRIVHDFDPNNTTTSIQSIATVGNTAVFTAYAEPDLFGPFPDRQTGLWVSDGTSFERLDAPSLFSPDLNLLAQSGSNVIFSALDTNQQRSLWQFSNAPPVATLTGPISVIEGDGPVAFNGGASSDPEGLIAALEWDLSYDGNQFNVDATGVGLAYADTQDGPRNATIALRVRDYFGTTVISTTQLSVQNAAPVIEGLGDLSSELGQAIQFSASVSDAGPLDTLTYEWDLGDGTSSTSPSLEHTYASEGEYFASLTVRDNDGAETTQEFRVVVAPSLQLRSTTSTVTEEETQIEIFVDHSQTAPEDIVIPLSFGGDSVLGADYQASSSSIIIPQGESTASVLITVLDDALSENDEQILIDLGLPSNASFSGGSQFAITIQDEDPLPQATLLSSGGQVDEDAGVIQITAQISEPAGRDVLLPLSFSGTASLGLDYELPQGTSITIPEGMTSASLDLRLLDDELGERSESIFVALQSSSTASLSLDPSALLEQAVVISSSDIPTVALRDLYRSVSESHGLITAEAQLSNPTSERIVVPFTTSGTLGTSEFSIAGNYEFVFEPGETVSHVEVSLIDDNFIYSTLANGGPNEELRKETLVLELETTSEAIIGGRSSYTLAVLDDDRPTVTISLTNTEGKTSQNGVSVWENQSLYATAELSKPAAEDIIVFLSSLTPLKQTLQWRGGTPAEYDTGAERDEDYELSNTSITIPAGSTSVDLPISITPDDVTEETERALLLFLQPHNADLAKSTTYRDYTVDILAFDIKDDDPYVWVESAKKNPTRPSRYGIQLTEDASDELVAKIDRPSNLDVSVELAEGYWASPFIGVSKATTSDVRVRNAAGQTTTQIVVEAGELSSEPVTVTAYDDTIEEGIEGFSLTTTSSSSGSLFPDTFYYSILASDIPEPPPIADIVIGFRKDRSQDITVGEQSKDLIVDISLSRALDSDIEIKYGIVGEPTAKSPSDFRIPGITDQTIKVPAGKKSVSFSIDIVDDKKRELKESVELGFVLSKEPAHPETAQILNISRKLRLTIKDNDRPASTPGTIALSTGEPLDAGVIDSSATAKVTLGSCATTASPLTLQICDGNSTFSGSDGALAGASVFLDTNFNQVRDLDSTNTLEPSTETLRDGSFAFPFETLDTNLDGAFTELDGFVILSGGIDISTGVGLDYQLSAPGGFYSITPGTTVISSLVQAMEFSADLAHDRFTEAFAIEGLDLRNIDPLAEHAEGDPLATRALAVNMQLQSTVHQLVALVSGLNFAPQDRFIAQAAFDDIAEKISDTGSKIDLTEPSIIKSILLSSTTKTATQASDELLEVAADIIARGNQFIREASLGEPEDFLDAAVRSQIVANRDAAAKLLEVASNEAPIEELTQGFSEVAYSNRVAAASPQDTLPAVLAVTDVSLSESASGGIAEFTVILPRPSVNIVSVSYNTEDGSAVAGSDYTAVSGTLTWQPGDTTPRVVQVPIHNDNVFETDEQFGLLLSDPQFAALRRDLGYAFIINDDLLELTTDGASSVNDLTLTVNGNEAALDQNGQILFSGPFSEGATTTITGTQGTQDVLTINLGADNRFLQGGLNFVGNYDDDELVLTSETALVVEQQISGPDSGEILIDGRSISYQGVASINHTRIPSLLGFTSGLTEGETLVLQAELAAELDSSVLDFLWEVRSTNNQIVSSLSGQGLSDFAFAPADDGTFTLSLTITDSEGFQSVVTTTLEVANAEPKLVARGASSTNEGSEYTLELFASDPGNDSISAWTVDWGDGSTPEVFAGSVSSVTHVYTDGPNTFMPSVTATDEDGTWNAQVIPASGAITPDLNFGNLGAASIDLGLVESPNDYFHTMDIQPDGRIVAAGQYRYDGGGGFALARFNSDGSLDTSFGAGDGDGVDGVVLLPSEQAANSIVVHPNGRIIVGAGPWLFGFDATGAPDNSFGNLGPGNNESVGFFTQARDLAVDAQGRIVAVGYRSNYTNPATGERTTDMIVTRFTEDGIEDDSFAANDGDGRDGVSIIDIGSGGGIRSNDDLSAVTIDDQGRIIAVGRGSHRLAFATLRFTEDGLLDPTFGTGPSYFYNSTEIIEDVDGMVLSSLRSTNWSLTDVALDSSGRVIAGSRSTMIALLPNGALDPSFGDAGASYTRSSLQVAVDDEDHILAIGGTVITRVRPDGSDDPLFGPSGEYTTPGNVGVHSSHLDRDGNVLIASGFRPEGTTGILQLGIQKFVPATLAVSVQNVAPTLVLNGPDEALEGQTLSYTFTTTDPGDDTFSIASLNAGPNAQVSNVVFDSNSGSGSFDVTVSDGPSQMMIALQVADSDGALSADPGQTLPDARFGTDGFVVTEIADNPRAVAVREDGKTVVAGYVYTSTGSLRPGVVRYNKDGSLDPSFGVGGAVELPFSGSVEEAIALPDGKLLLRISNLLIRLNQDGSRDFTFGDYQGRAIVSFFPAPTGDATVLLSNGDFIVMTEVRNGTLPYNGGTTTNYDLGMARFTSDGLPDSSFGTDGVKLIDLGQSNDQFFSVTLDTTQPAGERLVVLGSRRVYDPNSSSSTTSQLIVRMSTDGELDSTFAGGLGYYDGQIDSRFSRSKAAVDQDGSIVIVGTYNFGDRLAAARRLLADGSGFDLGFGVDGLASVQLGERFDSIGSVHLDSDRRITMAGGTNIGNVGVGAALRFHSDGSLDESFGEGGIAFLNTDFASDLAVLGSQVTAVGRATGTRYFGVDRLAPGQIQVDVANVAPTLSINTLAIEVNEGQTAGNTGSFGDVPADNVTISADFGTVSQDDTTGTWSWEFDSVDDLTQVVTITATDDDGASTSISFDLVATNVAPTASITNTGPVDESSPVSVSLESAFDPSSLDAAALRYSFALSTSTLAADYASADIENTAQFTFPDEGTYTVYGRVFDDDGGITDYSTDVEVKNVAPTLTINATEITIEEGQTAINGGSYGDVGLNDAITLTASFGDLLDHGDGTWSWSYAAADDLSTTQVVITASDDDGAVTHAAFDLTATNVLPTIQPIDDITVDEGELYRIFVNWTDPGYSEGSSEETFRVRIDWGDASASGTGGSVQNGGPNEFTSGFATTQHAWADNRVHTVTVTVTDDDGGVGVETFDVTVLNVAPTISPIADVATVEGSQFDLSVLITDPGFNQDWFATQETIDVLVDWGDGSITSGPASMTNGRFGVASEGRFETGHTYADNGLYTVTVTATDDDDGATSTTFEVAVDNLLPTISVDSLVTIVNEGQTAGNAGSFGDVPADNVTISADFGTVSQDNTTGTWSWEFDSVDDLTQVVTITATDDDGASTSISFDLTIFNVAPTASIINSGPVDESSPVSVSLDSALDPSPLDAAALRYSFALNTSTLAAAYASADPDSTAQFTFPDEGTYIVYGRVFDDDGGFTDYSTDVEVNNVAPTLTINATEITIAEGQTAINGGSYGDVGVNDLVTLTASRGTVSTNANGTWTWSYNGEDDLSTTEVLITATDNAGAATTVIFDLTVNNVAATFEAADDETLPVGSGVLLRNDILFVDPGLSDNHTLTVDYGDGSGEQTIQLTPTGVRSFDLAHTYANSGTFTITVSLSDGTATTIDNFDVTVNLEIFYDFSEVTYATSETDLPVSNFYVTVERSGATGIPSTVELVLTAGTASAGGDYNSGPIALSFAADELSQSVPIEILGDNLVEADENLVLSFANFSIGGLPGTSRPIANVILENDDAAPVPNAGGDYQIDEGSSLTLDASLSTDADDGLVGLSFRWDVDGDGDFDENVTGSNPTLSISELAALGLGDGPASAIVTVEASDGTNASSAQVLLTVNNVAPSIADRTFSLLENSANGTQVGVLTASDPGPDGLEFSITGGTSSTAFAIDPVSGALTVADASQLDYETTPVFELEITVTDDDGASARADVVINLINKASISGVVFVDTNENGVFDANEMGIDAAIVELLDEEGTLLAQVLTDEGGTYFFEDLDEGTYRVREVQPTGVTDGAEHVGSLGGTILANDLMELTLTDVDAYDYDFAELGDQLTSGDTAGIGFWQNKHGQNLIESGGSALAAWLTDKFGNIFGDSLSGASGAEVASFYRDQLFRQKGNKVAGPAKVDAQFMAVALSTFFTDMDLAGNVATAYGFNVSSTGIATRVINVGDAGEAFGVENGTDMTIMQLLLATNCLTDKEGNIDGFAHIYDTDGDGKISEYEQSLRLLAHQLFSFINGN